MVVVRTLQSPDGVLGLNGYWYLEESDGALMKFENEQKARFFVEEGGEDPDNEYIEYKEEQSIAEELSNDGY
jgi:hypothetical protein